MAYNSNNLKTQNELLMSNLMDFYNSNDTKQKNLISLKWWMSAMESPKSLYESSIGSLQITLKRILLYVVFHTKILPITHQDSRFMIITNWSWKHTAKKFWPFLSLGKSWYPIWW